MKPDEKYITVNTDASFSMVKGMGGFGIWIKCSSFTIKKAGQFAGAISDSNEAELKALINAVHLIKDRMLYDHILVVNCDNKTVRDIINKGIKTKRLSQEVELLNELVKPYKQVYAKTIRGHKKSHNERQYVNNWCDKASREYYLKKGNGKAASNQG